MNENEKNITEETLEQVSGGVPVIDRKHREDDEKLSKLPSAPTLVHPSGGESYM